MSGIVGILNLDGAPVDRELLQRMTAFMDYRGPDAQSIWIDGSVGAAGIARRSFKNEAWLTASTCTGPSMPPCVTAKTFSAMA